VTREEFIALAVESDKFQEAVTDAAYGEFILRSHLEAIAASCLDAVGAWEDHEELTRIDALARADAQTITEIIGRIVKDETA
jgi:hypothetical protein